jgi:hypothetical protein
MGQATIAGDLSLVRAVVKEQLNLGGIVLGRSLFLAEATLGGRDTALILRGAKIADQLNAPNVIATGGTANMDSLILGGSMALRGEGGRKARYAALWLVNAKIDGEFDLSDAAIGVVTMNGIEIGKDLLMRNDSFTDIFLRNARIGGDLAFEGPKVRTEESSLRIFDLAGASIQKALILGSDWYGPINWPAEVFMNLAGVSVHQIQDGFVDCDRPDSECWRKWPRHVNFAGFKFEELLGSDNEMAARPAGWWLTRLNGQARFLPATYDQLASALSAVGYGDEAKVVLYTERNRELGNTHGLGKIPLMLQLLFIGYGYRLWYSAFWAAGFVALGALLLRVSGEGQRNKLPYGIAYSFDTLLPVVHLRELHYKIDLRGWVRYYFYFHKLMGYLLASFLVAGLSGLTK